MNIDFIINMLVLNAFNYHKFGDEHYKQAFTNWMDKLRDIKRFNSIEEACDYFLAQGEMQGENKLTA
jgi:hypothetical protein